MPGSSWERALETPEIGIRIRTVAMFPFWIDVELTSLPELLIGLVGAVSLFVTFWIGPR